MRDGVDGHPSPNNHVLFTHIIWCSLAWFPFYYIHWFISSCLSLIQPSGFPGKKKSVKNQHNSKPCLKAWSNFEKIDPSGNFILDPGLARLEFHLHRSFPLVIFYPFKIQKINVGPICFDSIISNFNFCLFWYFNTTVWSSL